jgi:hypothetical protein
MLKALVLIVGPLLCGAVFFLTEAPAQTPGAYVELPDGVYRLPPCVAGSSPITGLSTTAPAAPEGVRSFYVLSPDSASAPARARSARLYLKVVNHAEPQTDYGRAPLGTMVHRMHPHVYRVTSDQSLRWDSGGVIGSVYRQALARMPGHRATIDLLLELDVPESSGGSCRYAVTLGSPPAVFVFDDKWFVLPGERRR